MSVAMQLAVSTAPVGQQQETNKSSFISSLSLHIDEQYVFKKADDNLSIL